MPIRWCNPLHPVAFAVALLACTPLVAQSTRAGVELPSTFEAEGKVLALASCGVRDTLWIEHYVAALYVRPGQPTADRLRDPGEPKAILMHVVREASLPQRIPEQWREPLREELKEEPLTQVRTAYAELGAGDRVRLTYVPGKGATIRVNDGVVATTPSHDLISAVLHTWAGKDPLSGKLQRLLLEHPC
ncbi:MAG: chalcone isomerase family protein [Methylibium sp.]|uniref:chalcone isomerase family protein n=1 Tax=Methylibium sp. TaxID=2067992 RepID=UPI00180D84B8|nr:chalcone isomerase family protein [Methylibium sp.]MBA2723630.1 chalcone isomerase family protein [Methylibium sp.]MBA3588624.1 chalcone isomerase family protein [Methylibium sp.]